MQDDPQLQHAIDDLIIRSANQIAKGKSKAEVIALLEKEGLPSDLSVSIATKGEEIKKAEFRKNGKATMLVGVGLCALGMAATALSAISNFNTLIHSRKIALQQFFYVQPPSQPLAAHNR